MSFQHFCDPPIASRWDCRRTWCHTIYKYVFVCMCMPTNSLSVFKFAEILFFWSLLKQLLHANKDYSNFLSWMQERLSRSLMVCQDKYEAAKVQKKPGAMNDLESCVEQSTQDGIKMLPHLSDRLKASFSISG